MHLLRLPMDDAVRVPSFMGQECLVVRYGVDDGSGASSRFARWLHSPEHVFVYVPLPSVRDGVDGVDASGECDRDGDVHDDEAAVAVGNASTRLTFRQAATGEREERRLLSRRPAVWRGAALDGLVAGRYRVGGDRIVVEQAHARETADESTMAPEQQLAVAFSVEADVVPQPWRRFRAVDLPVANSDRNES